MEVKSANQGSDQSFIANLRLELNMLYYSREHCYLSPGTKGYFFSKEVKVLRLYFTKFFTNFH